MEDQERLARVRAMRTEGCTPKQVARALGVAPSEAVRLVRHVAREDASRAPGPPVVGCWVSPGWSEGLEAPSDWPDTNVPDGIGHGIVSVLVARQHRRGKVFVTGYLVDVYCLGVKDVLGPKVMDDGDLRAFVRMYFLVYQAPALAAPIEMARELVWGAVAYARELGFEPHPDFAQASGELGAWEPVGAVRFGREGRPYFVQGVRDNAMRILATLERSVGKGELPLSRGRVAGGELTRQSRNGAAGEGSTPLAWAGHGRSRMTAIVARNWARTAGPTLPRVATILDVARSSRPVWTRTSKEDRAFFVRMNNSTRPLPEGEVESYVADRWPAAKT